MHKPGLYWKMGTPAHPNHLSVPLTVLGRAQSDRGRQMDHTAGPLLGRRSPTGFHHIAGDLTLQCVYLQ